MATTLPTFEEMRGKTRELLGDAYDELRSDWATGTGPTDAQADAKARALHHISVAMAVLDGVAR